MSSKYAVLAGVTERRAVGRAHRDGRPGLGRNRIGKQGYNFGNYEASLFDRTICERAFVEESGRARAGTGS